MMDSPGLLQLLWTRTRKNCSGQRRQISSFVIVVANPVAGPRKQTASENASKPLFGVLSCSSRWQWHDCL